MLNSVYFALCGGVLFLLGLWALILQAHLIRKVLGLNIAASGVFLILAALAYREPGLSPDPVPHAMVITGLVVSVAATALLLALILRLVAEQGHAELHSDAGEKPE